MAANQLAGRRQSQPTYWLKIAYFSYPSLIRRPRSLCSLWNFAAKLTARKLESWSYPTVKTACRFGMIPACERWSDGRSDSQTDRIYHR